MDCIKKIVSFVFLWFVVITLSQCRSVQRLETSIPFELGQAYYQPWVAGIQGGGYGVNLYITMISNVKHIELDSVYFQGKAVKLQKENGSLYVGRFRANRARKQDLIMSKEPYAEYGNQVPKLNKSIPFELKDNQCVISYKEINKTKYFRIDHIEKKQILAYPSAPPIKE